MRPVAGSKMEGPKPDMMLMNAETLLSLVGRPRPIRVPFVSLAATSTKAFQPSGGASKPISRSASFR